MTAQIGHLDGRLGGLDAFVRAPASLLHRVARQHAEPDGQASLDRERREGGRHGVAEDLVMRRLAADDGGQGDEGVRFRGVGERAEFFAAYEQGGGGSVDAAAVRYWEAFGNLKWAVICIAQARTFLDGGVPSLELASLGRRTAEVEHELLALID